MILMWKNIFFAKKLHIALRQWIVNAVLPANESVLLIILV